MVGKRDGFILSKIMIIFTVNTVSINYTKGEPKPKYKANVPNVRFTIYSKRCIFLI